MLVNLPTESHILLHITPLQQSKSLSHFIGPWSVVVCARPSLGFIAAMTSVHHRRTCSEVFGTQGGAELPTK